MLVRDPPEQRGCLRRTGQYLLIHAFVMKIAALRTFLESWPYEPENDVRVVRGADGREAILVRQPMGLEVYEIDGRPDGRRVHGMASVFDFHRARINGANENNAANGFDLTAEDCAELFDEGILYYHRLIFLFWLKDWTRVERDAGHCLRLIEFIKQHARCEEDQVQLDHWRPEIARISAAAHAMILLKKNRYQDALRLACGVIGISEAVTDDGPDHGKLAEALLKSVRESLVNRLALPMGEESLFLRRNDYWMIRYHGHSALLKSMRGLYYLAVLLRYPEHEFHVSELLVSSTEPPIPILGLTANGHLPDAADQLIATGFADAGPVLDAQTKTECKRRLNDLRQELKEVKQFNDRDRAVRVQDEMHAIAQYLASAVGLGGRDRRASSEAERARCAITKRVKAAIQKIGDAIPSLGHHLTARIKTGYFFSYNPHPDRPVAWKF